MKFFLKVEDHVEDGKFNEIKVCIYDPYNTSEFSFIQEPIFYDDEKYVPFLIKNINKLNKMYIEKLMEGDYNVKYIADELKKVLSADISYFKHILSSFKEQETKVIMTNTFPKTFLKFKYKIKEKWPVHEEKLLSEKKFIWNILNYKSIYLEAKNQFGFVNSFLDNNGFDMDILSPEEVKALLEGGY